MEKGNVLFCVSEKFCFHVINVMYIHKLVVKINYEFRLIFNAFNSEKSKNVKSVLS